MSDIRFTLNGRPVAVSGLAPTTTLLNWLRANGHTGTKEGCAEGDCGACTVALLEPETARGPAWRAINACLVLLPTLQGREVLTVEGLAAEGALHPAQAAMVKALGSQCGYCTPGFVMSLFEATYRDDLDAPWKLDDQLCGNLCRCTGYRPIRDALGEVAGSRPDDAFRAALELPEGDLDAALDYAVAGERFVQPDSLDGALALLHAHPDARVVSGATDLGLEVTKQHRRWPLLLSLAAVPELRLFHDDGQEVRVGAGVTLSDLEDRAARSLPAVARMLRFFAARQIKNRATVGGNLCNASPIGDLAPALMALDARAVLASVDGHREVPLRDFFLAYRKTAMRPGELLVAVVVPKPAADERVGMYKVSRRRELDISAVCAGMVVREQDGVVVEARLAYGGMAATTMRAPNAEAALVGRPWSEAAVRDAMAALESDFTPLSDHRGGAAYRMKVAKNLLLGFFLETGEARQPGLPDRPTATVRIPGGAR